jgi:hypothetical protein
MTYDEWIEIGLKNKFCGPAICETHDGLPMTLEEEDEFFQGFDPCIHIVRLYESPEIAVLVEDNHSPSNWRKPYDK